MSFKIVSTRRRGKVELSTVPSYWEYKGKLRWPKLNAELLAKDANSQPRADWSTVNCVTKRRGFLSYEEAEQELAEMCGKSDTETDYVERYRNDTSQSSNYQCADFNSEAQSLIGRGENRNESRASCSTEQIPLINETSGVYYEVVTTEQNQTTENTDTVQPVATVTDINTIYSMMGIIMDNQDKIMRKLAEISVQIEDNKQKENNQSQNVFVTPLAQSRSQSKRIIIKAMDKIEDLEAFDAQLSNTETYAELMQKYSILCSVVPGSGTTCAYRLLDSLFTKDFLCKCSWTGGSRGDQVKIGFKQFKNVISFFFDMIHTWDNTYKVEEIEKFFKVVLRNALKRKDTKNIRTSAMKKKRKPKTKPTNKDHTQNNDENINDENKGTNYDENDTNNDENDTNNGENDTNNKEKENNLSDEEIEESLC